MAGIHHKTLPIVRGEYILDHDDWIDPGTHEGVFLGSLGADAWVVAYNASIFLRDYAEVLQNSGYPVWLCNGVDDDVELQAAYNYLATLGGGKLQTTFGLYNITTTVYARAYVTLEGMGWGDVGIAGSDTGCTVFKSAGAISCFIADTVDGVQFRNFKIRGDRSQASGYGLEIDDCDWIIVDSLCINDIAGDGFYCHGGSLGPKINNMYIRYIKGRGFHLSGVTDAQCHNIVSVGCGNNSIHIGACSNGQYVAVNGEWSGEQGFRVYNGNCNILIGCNCDSSDDNGFSVESEQYTQLVGCHSYNNGQDAGAARRAGLEIVNSTDIVVIGGEYYDRQGAPTQQYGIYESGTSDYNIIMGNNCRIGNVVQGIRKIGANTKVERNIGYVTENKGSSTGTGGQQTIAHGLNITPTAADIMLWNIEAGANPYHSAAPDAANIYVTAVINQDWGWATAP